MITPTDAFVAGATSVLTIIASFVCIATYDLVETRSQRFLWVGTASFATLMIVVGLGVVL